ncbi:MAG: putative bifunctional exonuclease/endonuclease protein [Acidimicrobiales bacterium]|nr:MAG: DEDD exnuclease domain-containing protein [Actinomycetota bacterium]MBV6508797.1 putative bifunctional exonuclease/endonuclease protein [Acidimicrobiales bacterium]RIK03661.1 MAG: DEDD exnuclease domain-containing protein [Acidobacteriota bacterium]
MSASPAAVSASPGCVQPSFDELGLPLAECTFCVVDLETTGGSPRDCRITEVGAVRLRTGECLGTFQTLVNPGVAVPPSISILTGITDTMVIKAPRIEEVLPAFLEFLGDSVIVGHNVRFDLGFLNHALARDDRPALANRFVDTMGLARRLLRDEVPNCRLDTLADRLRLPHRPSHRALDDAMATADLLHLILERAGSLGVLGLDDLLALPTMAGHPQSAKLRLTEKLPRSPGVYLFRDGVGGILYVGKASNLRQRVRSYFSTDTRRKVGQLLRETQRIDHKSCSTALEAEVLELRLIRLLDPRFNRAGRNWRKYTYLKLTLDEPFPRLAVARTVIDDGAFYLGPLPGTRFARRVAEAIESVIPLRRCRADVRRNTRMAPCAPAQLGVATCPCAGGVSESAYRLIVRRALVGLTADPSVLLDPLAEKMTDLATQERFEEAADVRDRADALATALRRQRSFDQLRRQARLVVEAADGSGAEVRRGRLVRSWPGVTAERARVGSLPGMAGSPLQAIPDDPGGPETGPLPKELADEVLCLARWLDDNAGRLRVVHVDGEACSTLPRLPSLRPTRAV